jgi:hypothetical protein
MHGMLNFIGCQKNIHLVNQSFSQSSLILNEYYLSIPLSFSVCCLPFFANVLIAGYYSPMCNFRPVLCGRYLSFFPRVFFPLNVSWVSTLQYCCQLLASIFRPAQSKVSADFRFAKLNLRTAYL